MSIEVLKQELAGLPLEQRGQVMAFLVALQDEGDLAYRATLARKIDEKNPQQWIDLDEFDRRLGEKRG